MPQIISLREVTFALTLAIGSLLILGLSLPASAQDRQTEEWTGRLADGSTLTREKLDEILDLHKQWLVTGQREGKRAVLSGAVLREADLSGADLREADLSGADLSGALLDKASLGRADLTAAVLLGAILRGADLSEAEMIEAVLSKANLREAHLNGAFLIYADLSKVKLREAHLNDAVLYGANLASANLFLADLSGANLREADLSRANLRRANLFEADLSAADLNTILYEPRLGSLPIISSMASAHGLSTLRFEESPHGLLELREAIKKGGLRDQERQVTYAIEHRRTRKLFDNSSILVASLRYVLLELTCEYGMSPWRPIRILLIILLICFFPYTLAVKTRWGTEINKVQLADDKREEENIPTRFFHALWFGFYYSLLSAFRIGWRDVNVGHWVARLQFSDYSLRAKGWARSLSGLQSLVSIYLLFLWAITYFGRLPLW